ncbi:MAG: hypothetical protein QXE79_05020 [Candidatus Bathyarchaeia archaeon]
MSKVYGRLGLSQGNHFKPLSLSMLFYEEARVEMKPAIIVHGGAWGIPEGLVEAHREAVWRAALEGFKVLGDGGSALDGEGAAVNRMAGGANL